MYSRLTAHLDWMCRGKSPEEHLVLDVPLPPREKAIYLLHVAAGVEHALMVQYLYAAYSLGNPNLNEKQRRKTLQWRNVILEIARQEMGHLATIQNVLTLIGGPLAFQRQDYPIRGDSASLYPFNFELEPLTKKSLGKYVLAEMPANKEIRKLERARRILKGEMEAIQQRVGMDSHAKDRIHRVGIIYELIINLFLPPSTQHNRKRRETIVSADIWARSAKFQVRPDEWDLGYQDLLIGMPTDRKSAQAVIRNIDAQGEGLELDEFSESHFGRFLNIYRNFPEKDCWQPTRELIRNPSTDRRAPYDRQITHPVSLLWAKLFNLRYWMLLMFLSHSFYIEFPVGKSKRPTKRGLLISWAFGEMYNLQCIAEILMRSPLREAESELYAGPPFEMPYSLGLSPREPGRWRQHRDLFLASQEQTRFLLSTEGRYETYLQGLSSADQRALDQIATVLQGLRP